MPEQNAPAGSRTVVVKTTVELPGPLLVGLEHDGRVFVALDDVLEHVEATASAFDAAHANDDVARSFRAFGAAIAGAAVKR